MAYIPFDDGMGSFFTQLFAKYSQKIVGPKALKRLFRLPLDTPLPFDAPSSQPPRITA